MTNYTTKDFSQIHPPKDKPVNVGMYPAYIYPLQLEYLMNLHAKDVPYSWLLCKWDGRLWRHLDATICFQDRYWFGLREKQS